MGMLVTGRILALTDPTGNTPTSILRKLGVQPRAPSHPDQDSYHHKDNPSILLEGKRREPQGISRCLIPWKCLSWCK